MAHFTPFSDPDEVLKAVRPVTDLVHTGLFSILPQTRQYFDSCGRPVDKALHAMMTRHELKYLLLSRQIAAAEEEALDEQVYTLRSVANCGLVVNVANCTLRILKSQSSELPPANSAQRYEFYQHNLFSFDDNDPHPELDLPPLHLVAAWNTNTDNELAWFSIVCPLGENDGRVQSKWWRTLTIAASTSTSLEPEAQPEPELDEITLKGDGDEHRDSDRNIEIADDQIDKDKDKGTDPDKRSR